MLKTVQKIRPSGAPAGHGAPRQAAPVPSRLWVPHCGLSGRSSPDSAHVLSVALHLLAGPLLLQLPLQLLDLFPLGLMLLLGLPHLLHIAQGLWVPALLQVLWGRQPQQGLDSAPQ